LHGGLIVSCQAPEGSALNRPAIIAAMAAAAQQQAAVGVRIDGARNIRQARQVIKIPVIGIEKIRLPDSPIYITPTFESARRVNRAGADIVALDCTNRKRPSGNSLEEILQKIKQRLGILTMADIASLDEGLRAADLGVDLIATTLFGHTGATRQCHGPGFQLLRQLVRKVEVPVVLEGCVRNPDQVRKAFDWGAYAVVVGAAITNIEWLVHTFVEVTPRWARRRRCRTEEHN
jgi:N-acylglucosamine-6-phosphate 2-epimerase